MAISPQQLTIYSYSAHRAVIFAIAQLSCNLKVYINGLVNFCRHGSAKTPVKKCMGARQLDEPIPKSEGIESSCFRDIGHKCIGHMIVLPFWVTSRHWWRVTIRFPIGHFLFVVHWNQASISNGVRDIGLQR